MAVCAAIAVISPAGATAAGANFSITVPADGSVRNTIPSTPSFSFSPVYAFSPVPPDCDYTGNGLASVPQPCNASNEQPSIDGMYSLTVSGMIANTSPPSPPVLDSDTVLFEYDRTLPGVSIDSPAGGAELPQTQPTFSFTVTDDLNGLPTTTTTTTCKIDGGAAAACSSPFTPAAPLSQGGHSLQVAAFDGANTGYNASFTFIVDTVAPIVSVIYPTPGVTIDSSVPEVNLSIEGATAGSFCKFDDQAYQPCGASWLGGSLADGAHTLHVRGVDIAGNVTVVVVPFFVDDAMGSTPVPYETSITGNRGGKVKNGKFKFKAGFSLLGPQGADPAVVCAAKVTVLLKPKGGRTYRKRVALRRSGESCRLSTTFTLARRFKGKRAKVTFRYPGTTALGALSRSKTIKKL